MTNCDATAFAMRAAWTGEWSVTWRFRSTLFSGASAEILPASWPGAIGQTQAA